MVVANHDLTLDQLDRAVSPAFHWLRYISGRLWLAEPELAPSTQVGGGRVLAPRVPESARAARPLVDGKRSDRERFAATASTSRVSGISPVSDACSLRGEKT